MKLEAVNFELAIAKISRYCKFASGTQAQKGNDPHPAPPPRHVSCPIGLPGCHVLILYSRHPLSPTIYNHSVAIETVFP